MFAKHIVSCLARGRYSNLSVVAKSRLENRDKGKMGLQRPPCVGSEIAEDPGASREKTQVILWLGAAAGVRDRYGQR